MQIKKSKDVDLVIVGAGLSGIYLAKEIQKKFKDNSN